MISNKLLKTQEQSLDLDSIAGPARCTPLKDKPTECGTRCSKILTSRVKLIWTKLPTRDVNSVFWGTEYSHVLEYHPSIRRVLPTLRCAMCICFSIINSGFRPHRLDPGKDQAVGNNLPRLSGAKVHCVNELFNSFFFSVTSVPWHPWWIFLILDQQ